MNEVKRFKPVINDKPYKPYAHCEESEDGIYVRLADYAELKAQRDALAAENANLRHLLNMVGETGNANFGRTKLPTPATDAYLNSVRAEGADAAGQKLRRAIPLFKSIHAGAVGECADIAEMIAAQLRAGEPS